MLPTITKTQRVTLMILRDHEDPWLSLGKRKWDSTVVSGYFIRPDRRIDKRTVQRLYDLGYIRADKWVKWTNGHIGYHAKAVITDRGRAALEEVRGRGRR